MTIERDPNYYRGWGDGAIDEVRFIITNDEATVRSMAASGELTMTSQYQSPDTYDTLAKIATLQGRQGRHLRGLLLEAQQQTAKPTDDVHIRRAIALATDYDTIRATILPGGDLNGPLPKTFAAAYLDCPRRNSTSPLPRRKSTRALRRSERHSALASIYVSATKFEEEIALLMQANLRADRLQGDALRRALEPHHRDRVESRNDAEHRRSVLRPDLSLARLDVLHAISLEGRGHVGVDGVGAEP